MKLIRSINWGFINLETLFVIGYSKKEVLERIKKFPKSFIDFVKDTDIGPDQIGFCAYDNKYNRTFIWFNDFYVKDWDCWDYLLHETRHAIDHMLLGYYRNELELLAYAHQNLFKLCRKVIFEEMKKVAKNKKNGRK